VTVRTDLRPGDIGSIVRFHGVTYSRECGFDHTFEAYVAKPLAEFAISHSDRERIWIAERDGQLVGCIAIVAASPTVAQLRWYLVDPQVRGVGLGTRLLRDALEFCRQANYQSVILWTVNILTVAAQLYRSVGFQKVEENPGCRWGVDLVEEKYECRLV
jgi:GNAT superfamily N-acetyltransferase